MSKSMFGLMMLATVAVMCTGCAQRTALFNGKDFTGWKLHVDDFELLPREFTCIDWAALQIHAEKGLPAPPGARFELVSKPMVGKG